MSSTGTTTPQVELLGPAGVDQLDLPAAQTKRPISSSGRWVAERPMRWNGSAVSRSSRSRLSARWEPRLVPATACTSSTITKRTVRSVFSRAGGQQEEQGLGGRDEDVRRVPEHRRALFRRGVPGANADRELRADARQGAAEVALDVVVERLERADVEHLDAFAGRRSVEGPEERGERLPRAGRRLDQRVLSRRDRRPAAFLGRRGRVEGLLEPAADGGAERGEGAHRFSVSRG